MSQDTMRLLLLSGIVAGAIMKIVGIILIFRGRRSRDPSETMIRAVEDDMKNWQSSKDEHLH
jgi:hypothetical protein